MTYWLAFGLIFCSAITAYIARLVSFPVIMILGVLAILGVGMAGHLFSEGGNEPKPRPGRPPGQ